MSILIIAVADFPDGFATAERIKMLAKAFMAAGESASVGLLHATRVMRQSGNETVSGYFEGINYRYCNGRVDRPKGFFHTLVDTIRGMYGAARYVRCLARTEALNAVVFYTPNGVKILPALVAARRVGLTVIFEFCEKRTAAGSEKGKNLKRRLSGFGDALSELMAPRVGDAMIVISSAIEAFYRGRGIPDKCIIRVPALVDVERYLSDLTPVARLSGVRYLLSTGSFSEKEGTLLLVEAFGTIARRYADVLLAFTGEPPVALKNRMFAIAKGGGCEDRVIFLGYLSRSELSWACNHAEGLLACRRRSEFAAMGFPTKFAEYLASAAPVLVTDVGDPHTYIDEGVNGFVASADDSASIAIQMARLLDARNGAEIGKRGRDVAMANFHYEAYSKDLQRICRCEG